MKCKSLLASTATLAAALLVASLPPSPAQTPVCTAGDINCDGRPDILWRNRSTGSNAVWYMGGATHLDDAGLPDEPNLDWQIGGTGDFDGDSRIDIVWRNRSTGQNVAWSLSEDEDDGNIDSYEPLPLPAETDTNWRVVATGDFDGNGRSDLVWQNQSNGQVRFWLLNGTALVGVLPLGTESDLNWQIVGSGDFDADGRPDLFWRNRATGQVRLWYVTGSTFTSSGPLQQVENLNWDVAGVGDFARLAGGAVVGEPDGRPDVLWRHALTGENALWVMQGTTVVSTAYLPQVLSTVALETTEGLSSTPQTPTTASPWAAVAR